MKSLVQLIFIFSITAGFSQSLLTDPSTGCKYLLPWDCTECTVEWTGGCIDSLPNGKGELTVLYESGEVLKYVGQMKNGNFDGAGSYIDGMSKLEGFFKNGNLINVKEPLFKNLDVNQISENDIGNINISFNGSDNLYYYAIKTKNQPKGAVVLFPSLYEQPEQVINNNTELIELLNDNNVLVIIPSINFNMCLTDVSVNFINQVLLDAIERYETPIGKFILGGFSLGGASSLRYTELAYQDSTKTAIQPKAVFTVDPPVNYISLYNTELKFLKNDSTNSEAKVVIEQFQKQIGEPINNLDGYFYYSIYSNTEKDGGNAKYLRNTPIRIYCDPDIDWWMKNREMSYYDMNALDQSAMILELNKLGNSKAEFIVALGKGYRSNGKRQPHSWNLIEPIECVSWILTNLE